MAKSSPFAATEDNTLYIKLRYAGIHYLVVLHDGLPLTFFGKNRKTPYLKVTDAIEWHRKELKDSRGVSGNQKVLDALMHALDKNEQGQVADAEAEDSDDE